MDADERSASARGRWGSGLYRGTQERRLTALSERGRAWVERQDPSSPSGVAIGAWERYRAVEGPLQSALLSLYMLVAVVPR